MRRYLTRPWTRTCTVWIVFVLCSQNLDSDAALESCMRGTYMTRHGSGMDICDVCEDGTFMPDADHKHRQCNNCSRVVNATIDVVIQPCTIYQDAIIQCIDGYYRKRARNGRAVDECTLCSTCKNITRKCMNYTDTVCCLPNFEAVESFADFFHCEERPCGLGQYFNMKTDQCMQCPQATYMPQNVHKHTSCLKCARLEHSSTYNSRIFHACTDQSATIFGCLDGYFRDFTGPSLATEAMCTPCTECQCGVARSCFDIGDTVCNACEDPSTPSVNGVTDSAGSNYVLHRERRCWEHVNCECQPRYVNGSQCECSDCPRNYFTSTSHELEVPTLVNQPDNHVDLHIALGICVPLIIIVPLCVIIIYKKWHGKQRHENMKRMENPVTEMHFLNT